MATIGRRSAVAELPLGIRLRGTLGWLAWLGLHLVFLVGFRNRLVVFVNWVWNYFTWDRGNRIIIPPGDGAADRSDWNQRSISQPFTADRDSLRAGTRSPFALEMPLAARRHSSIAS